MKKLFLGTLLFIAASVVPITAMARVDVSIGISLPPLVVFEGPPDVIVLPDTDDVYVVPDVEVEIFFWNGWWWRPWEGRWYRSHYYDHGWAHYNCVPEFYYDIDPGWRGHYRHHIWQGHHWNYERIPHRQLEQNWHRWHGDRYWERHGTWGVQSYQPRPQHQRQEIRHQREEQYHRRSDVLRERQRIQAQQRQEMNHERQEQFQHRPMMQQEQQQRQPHVQQQQQRQEVSRQGQEQYQHQRGDAQLQQQQRQPRVEQKRVEVRHQGHERHQQGPVAQRDRKQEDSRKRQQNQH